MREKIKSNVIHEASLTHTHTKSSIVKNQQKQLTHTCMDDIPKSIKMPSTPVSNSFLSTSLSTDLICLKFFKMVCVFRSEVG